MSSSSDKDTCKTESRWSEYVMFTHLTLYTLGFLWMSRVVWRKKRVIESMPLPSASAVSPPSVALSMQPQRSATYSVLSKFDMKRSQPTSVSSMDEESDVRVVIMHPLTLDKLKDEDSEVVLPLAAYYSPKAGAAPELERMDTTTPPGETELVAGGYALEMADLSKDSPKSPKMAENTQKSDCVTLKQTRLQADVSQKPVIRIASSVSPELGTKVFDDAMNFQWLSTQSRANCCAEGGHCPRHYGCCECQGKKCKCTFKKCCGSVFDFIHELYNLKRIVFPAFAHFTDEASDIGVCVLWYSLWQAQRSEKTGDDKEKTVCTHLDMGVMFLASLMSLLMYRVISTFLVYRMTKDWKRVIRQAFDVELLEAIRINFQRDLKEPCNPMRWLLFMEATYEASLQALLQFVFLAKTYNTSASGRTLVFASFVWSLIVIVNRLVAEDATVFAKQWKDSGLDTRWNRVFKCKCGPKNNGNCCYKSHLVQRSFWFSTERVDNCDAENDGVLLVTICGMSFNANYLERRLWRILDVTLRVLILGFIWLCAGGKVVAGLLGFEALVLCCVAAINDSTIFVSGLVGSLFVLSSDFTKMFSKTHFVYRKTVHLVSLVICSFLMSNDIEHAEDFGSPSFASRRQLWRTKTTRFLFLYCWLAWFVHYVWYVRLCTYLLDMASTDRKISELMINADTKGLAELADFGMKIDGTKELLNVIATLVAVDEKMKIWIDVMETLFDINQRDTWHATNCTECFRWALGCSHNPTVDSNDAKAWQIASEGTVGCVFDLDVFVSDLVIRVRRIAYFKEVYGPMLSGVWVDNDTKGVAMERFFQVIQSKKRMLNPYDRLLKTLFEVQPKGAEKRRTVAQEILAVDDDSQRNAVWCALLRYIPNRANIWRAADRDGWNALMLALKNQSQEEVWRVLMYGPNPLSQFAPQLFSQLWTARGVVETAEAKNEDDEGALKLNALAIAIRYQKCFKVWEMLISECHLSAEVWTAPYARDRNAFWYACEHLSDSRVWKLLIEDGAILDESIWNQSSNGKSTARIFLENQHKLEDSLLRTVVNAIPVQTLLLSVENGGWDVMDLCHEKELSSAICRVVLEKIHGWQHVFCLSGEEQLQKLLNVSEDNLDKAVQRDLYAKHQDFPEKYSEDVEFASIAVELASFLKASDLTANVETKTFTFQMKNDPKGYYAAYLIELIQSEYGDGGYIWYREDVRVLMKEISSAVPKQALEDLGLETVDTRAHVFLEKLLAFLTDDTCFEVSAVRDSDGDSDDDSGSDMEDKPKVGLLIDIFEAAAENAKIKFCGIVASALHLDVFPEAATVPVQEFISSVIVSPEADASFNKIPVVVKFATKACRCFEWRKIAAESVSSVVDFDKVISEMVAFDSDEDEVKLPATVATKVDDLTFALFGGKLEFHSSVPGVATVWQLALSALALRKAQRRVDADYAIVVDLSERYNSHVLSTVRRTITSRSHMSASPVLEAKKEEDIDNIDNIDDFDMDVLSIGELSVGGHVGFSSESASFTDDDEFADYAF